MYYRWIYDDWIKKKKPKLDFDFYNHFFSLFGGAKKKHVYPHWKANTEWCTINIYKFTVRESYERTRLFRLKGEYWMMPFNFFVFFVLLFSQRPSIKNYCTAQMYCAVYYSIHRHYSLERTSYVGTTLNGSYRPCFT